MENSSICSKSRIFYFFEKNHEKDLTEFSTGKNRILAKKVLKNQGFADFPPEFSTTLVENSGGNVKCLVEKYVCAMCTNRLFRKGENALEILTFS